MTESTAAATPSPPKRTKAPHLYEVDVVRILTFACVIAVHTTSHTVADDDLVLYGFFSLVHFTREVFFALTAFVLVYSYLNRPQPMKSFLPRRFLLVGVPYVVWSIIYFAASNLRSPHGTFGEMLVRLGGYILTGTAWYHLYFLLVTMQVYLLVPVILWLVRRTRVRHALLLGISLAVQLALTALYMYFPDVTSGINDFNKQLFFSYQFFIIAGAVAADHSAAFLAWVRAHRRAIGFIVLAAALCTLGVYVVNMLTGRSPYRAGTPLQPIEMLWSIAVALGFLAVGTWWADRRDPRSLVAKGLDAGSDRSFGIFLSHPLFIWLLLWVGDDWLERTVPKPWLTLVTYVLVVLLSLGITELARRSWFSLGLTGRRFSSKKSVPTR
ncbi:acyltransferase [Glaciihabitans sp. INWT7]|uniref:acyltransferase n=1 Tax=Glaciihabitans sp. INWT7 TaxID=2596912 RepID=UPI00162354D1|nr:acyltransferase [Glaciihabitans sp. INWT7]QNE46835.1 acyltransferase [Glaciihabitans sp. INWT7]